MAEEALALPSSGSGTDYSEDNVSFGDTVYLSLYEPGHVSGFASCTLDFDSGVVHGLAKGVRRPHDLDLCRFELCNKFDYSVFKSSARFFPSSTEVEFLDLLNAAPSEDGISRKDSATGGNRGRGKSADIIPTSPTSPKSPGVSIASAPRRKETHFSSSALQWDEEKHALLEDVRSKVLEERVANHQECLRLSGEAVTFGSVIQLRHKTSQRFLNFCPQEMSDYEHGCNKVTMVPHGTDAAWLRVLPGFKSKSLGDAVKIWTSPYIAQTLEINAARQGSRFKFYPFALHSSHAPENPGDWAAQDSPQDADRLPEPESALRGCMGIQISNQETSSYLMCKTARDGAPQLVFEHRNKADGSSGGGTGKSTFGHWQVEAASPIWAGSHLTWKQQYYIKHTGTNLFLGSTKRKAWDVMRNAMSKGAFGRTAMLKTVASATVAGTYTLEMTDNYNSQRALWRIRPFEMWKEEKDPRGQHSTISSGSLVYLQNVATNGFLAQGQVLTDGSQGGSRTLAVKSHMACHENYALSLQRVQGISECIPRLYMVLQATKCLQPFLEELRTVVFRCPEDGSDQEVKDALMRSPVARVIETWVYRQTKMLEMTLKNLMPESSNPNMLTRDGPTDSLLQDYLRDRNYLDLLIALLEELFQEKAIPPKLIETLPVYGLLYMCQLVYRVLKQACKDHLANKNHLSVHIPVMQQHLGTEMKPANTILEIYCDNKELVQSIEDKHLNQYLELMRRFRQPRFAEFLVSCSDCSGQPVPLNQSRIAKFLQTNQDVMPLVEVHGDGVVTISDAARGIRVRCNDFHGLEDCLLTQDTSQMDDDAIFFCYYSKMLDLYHSICLGQRADGLKLLFKNARRLGLSYAALVMIICNTQLPSLQRSRSIKLLILMYISNFKESNVMQLPLVSHTRVWSGAVQPSEKGAAGVPEAQLKPSTIPGMVEVGPPKPKAQTKAPGNMQGLLSDQFSDLKDFIQEHLSSTSHFDLSRPGANQLTIAVLQLLNLLIHMGYYSRCTPRPQPLRKRTPGASRAQTPCSAQDREHSLEIMTTGSGRPDSSRKPVKPETDVRLETVTAGHRLDQFQPLIGPLVALLSGRHDVDTSRRRSSKHLTDADRSRLTERTRARIHICNIMRAMFEVRLDVRAKMTQTFFEKLLATHLEGPKAEAEGAKDEAEGAKDEAPVAKIWSEEDLLALRASTFETVLLSDLVALTPQSQSSQSPFVKTLLDLMKAEHAELVSVSFDLLYHHLMQRAALVEHQQHLQMLLTPDVVSGFLQFYSGMAEIQHYVHVLGSSSGQEFAEAVGQFEEVMCEKIAVMGTGVPKGGEPQPAQGARATTFQNIAVNVGMVDQVLQVLSMSFLITGQDPQQDRLGVQLLNTCHEFLVACCNDPINPAIQLKLWPHLPSMMQLMGTPGLDVASTLTAVLHGNSQLVKKVDAAILAKFTDLIKRHGHQSRWLRFFSCVLEVNNQLMPQNQEKVLFLLLEHRDALFLLWSDAAGFDRRRALMLAREHRDPALRLRSLLRYHVTLVEMLDLCMQGPGNLSMLRVVREILPFEVLVSHILDCARQVDRVPMHTSAWASADTVPETVHSGIPHEARCFVKAPFIRLLTTLYFKAEDAKLAIGMGYRLWACHAPCIPGATSILLMQDFIDDIRAAVRESAIRDYVCDAVLPCLEAYFVGVMEVIQPDFGDDEEVTFVSPEDILPPLRDLQGALHADASATDGMRQQVASLLVALGDTATFEAALKEEIPAPSRGDTEVLFEKLWGDFNLDLARVLGIKDLKRMLGQGMWNYAQLLAVDTSVLLDADSYAHSGSSRERLWHAALQLLRPCRPSATQPGRSDSPGLEAPAEESTSSRKEAPAREMQDDLVACIVRMLEGCTLSDRATTNSLRILRCGIYAEEPLLGPEAPGAVEHTAENFDRFVAGLPPVKHARTGELQNQLLQWIQKRYARAGVGKMALQCLSSKSDTVVTAARRLLITLLEGFGHAVQNMLHAQLVKGDPRSVRKTQQVFATLSATLEDICVVAGKYNHELVHVPGQCLKSEQWETGADTAQQSALSLTVEDINGMIGKTVSAYELLRMLQLMTEGQHRGMQDLVRTQAHCQASYDLVSRCIAVAEALQPLLEENLANDFPHLPLLMLQCLNTINEFVQGPCPENQRQVCHGDLVKLLTRMITSINAGNYLGGKSSGASRPPLASCILNQVNATELELWGWDISTGALALTLESVALTLLTSLLEGGDPQNALWINQKIAVSLFQKKLCATYTLLNRVEGCKSEAAQRKLLGGLANWPESWPAALRTQLRAQRIRAVMPTDGMLEMEDGEVAITDVRKLLRDICFGYITVLQALGQHLGMGVECFMQPIAKDRPEVHAFCRDSVGYVEMVIEEKVEKVFFPVPEACVHLRDNPNYMADFQKHLLSVPRKSPQGKVKVFLQLARQLAFEIVHMEAMRQDPDYSWMVKYSQHIADAPLYLSLAICLLIVTCHTETTVLIYDMYGWMRVLVHVLGALQMTCSALTIWKHVKINAPHEAFKMQEAANERHLSDATGMYASIRPDEEGAFEELVAIKRQMGDPRDFRQISILLQNGRMQWLISCMLLSVVSFFVSPLLYCLHVLVYYTDDPMAMAIVLAIRNVRSRIGSTLLLGCIVVMVFAFSSFVAFYDDLEAGYNDAGCFFSHETATGECSSREVTLFQTVAVHIQSAFLGLGLDPLLDPEASSASASQWRVTPLYIDGDFAHHARNFYNVLFSLVWQLVLLNVITGLIIDAFMTVRLEEQEKEMDTQQYCFICSFDHSVLDSLPNSSFEKHVQDAHNPWMYVCFMVYLNEKDKTDYSGFESYIYNHLVKGSTDVIPILRCYDKEVQHTKVEDESEKVEHALHLLSVEMKKSYNALERKIDDLAAISKAHEKQLKRRF
ncbi:hypothetical protein CYMTET_56220 [Cymbomonas tetramitiformis]|uniref:MIR domain-containing protein n=1 Tax=Cymbomonas tetramitiformis TaxID=36881 RepID=A0AAE0BBD3_9CHLO|nr:hypothetical protein CYMTET_56220 [Cymbomonas tetramitiformis]